MEKCFTKSVCCVYVLVNLLSYRPSIIKKVYIEFGLLVSQSLQFYELHSGERLQSKKT